MTENKMTDTEIMKALEFVFNKKAILNFRNESRGVNCQVTIADVIDLINRKNAEIERLRDLTRIWMPTRSGGKTLFIVKKYNEVRAEAIKEFAETAVPYTVQYAYDFVRMFIREKTKLDPVYGFNPTEKELNECFAEVRSIMGEIAKEMGVEL